MTDDGLAGKLSSYWTQRARLGYTPMMQELADLARAHFAEEIAQGQEIARLREPKCECGRDLKWICSRCDAGKPTKFDELTYRVEELEREQAEDRAAIRDADQMGLLWWREKHQTAVARAALRDE